MEDNVQLVIKIPKSTYEYWKTHSDEYVLAEAIKNGTPLSMVLAEIKAEIEKDSEEWLGLDFYDGINSAVEIIDKHISGEGDK